jgi:hypothetical protein
MAFWIPAALQAGSSLLNYALQKKNKPTSFSDTEEGKYLAGIRETGAISPQERGGLLARTGAIAGSQASQRKASIRGGLLARGMNNSIAGVRALDAPGRDTQRTLADAGQNIDIMNERSKDTAAREYATKSTQRSDMIDQYSANARGGLVQGLAGAGINAYGGLMDEKALAEDKRRWDITSAQRDRQIDNYAGKGASDPVQYPTSLSNMTPLETAQWALDNGRSLAETKQLQIDMRLRDIQMQLEGGQGNSNGLQMPGLGIQIPGYRRSDGLLGRK